MAECLADFVHHLRGDVAAAVVNGCDRCLQLDGTRPDFIWCFYLIFNGMIIFFSFSNEFPAWVGVCFPRYPLVMTNIAMEIHHVFHGTTHYFYGHGFNSKLLNDWRVSPQHGLNLWAEPCRSCRPSLRSTPSPWRCGGQSLVWCSPGLMGPWVVQRCLGCL